MQPSELHKQCWEATLTLFHLNPHSIYNKYHEHKMLLTSTGIIFEVLILTETWYTNSSNYLSLTNYDKFVLKRRHRRSRGVAMQVKYDINACDRKLHNDNKLL